jgi:hypothetical protein
VAGFSNDKEKSSSTGGRGANRAAIRREDEGKEAVARYLADMTGQLESMARAANLELLAYLLSMARAEADAVARKPPGEAGDPEP